MLVSVIVRSRDEADRLRLTLASLALQTLPVEVIVVNDASTDHTPAVLSEAARQMPLTIVTHTSPRGRAGAANAGATLARGDVLLFLDGDTLASRDLAARHAAVHGARSALIGRGETFHLRGTRFLQDPESGTPRPGEESRLARLAQDERTTMQVTRRQIVDDFTAIDRRAEPGVYPGASPRLAYELEMEALHRHPDLTVLWVAASGSNLSMRRDAFDAVGGFCNDLDINEHRELALRLCMRGARMAPVTGARSYHMTHRTGWRDPLQETRWEEVFYQAHPILAVKLLAVFWASLSGRDLVPSHARISSLPELETAARGCSGVDYDAVRRLIPGLRELPAATGIRRADHGPQAPAAATVGPQ